MGTEDMISLLVSSNFGDRSENGEARNSDSGWWWWWGGQCGWFAVMQEFDPPPWLNRLRELGYPPGYQDPDDDDQPSGITIFGNRNVREEHEDGDIAEARISEPWRKKSVEFPGINAPIPEKLMKGFGRLGLKV